MRRRSSVEVGPRNRLGAPGQTPREATFAKEAKALGSPKSGFKCWLHPLLARTLGQSVNFPKVYFPHLKVRGGDSRHHWQMEEATVQRSAWPLQAGSV